MDTFVIGLHNVLGIPASSLSRNNNNQYVTLDLFHFKENCNLVSSLQYDGTHGGSLNCFHCFNLDSSKLLVGARDGSLLLWDLSSSSSSSLNQKSVDIMTKYDYVSALTTLEKSHDDCVTDL